MCMCAHMCMNACMRVHGGAVSECIQVPEAAAEVGRLQKAEGVCRGDDKKAAAGVGFEGKTAELSRKVRGQT